MSYINKLKEFSTYLKTYCTDTIKIHFCFFTFDKEAFSGNRRKYERNRKDSKYYPIG